ncbi:hypothetical protein MMC27_002599 [Xylographa pallens]|nr:hypothetical protein [Xylographa pallens]
MEDQVMLSRVQDLTDVELALLLCLVANQHCIVETTEEALDKLEDEIQLIVSNVFGLSVAVVHCSQSTTLEDFSSGILISDQTTADDDPVRVHTTISSCSFLLSRRLLLPQIRFSSTNLTYTLVLYLPQFPRISSL